MTSRFQHLTCGAVIQRGSWIVSLILIAVGSGCLDALGLGSDLDTSFTVHPSTVAPGDFLTATLVVRNTSSDTVQLAGSSCFAGVAVFKGIGPYKSGEPLPMEGAKFACPDDRVPYTIAPHDSLVREYPLRAALSTNEVLLDFPNLTPGWYTLKTWMRVDLPDVECQFHVWQ